IPTGGVTPQTVADFLKAGSVAVGAGSTLVSKDALKRGDMAAITARAKEFVAAIKAARGV
ncbi:MAG TPA: 2-dehydro-3-deoxyphosphogluconate aldolase, partial [Chthoniobacteraceae bacterium]|nr:2-dehydro-3-deoxyphosphogluconate aldolase [Chthoniobacteraceae bacterium]